MNKLLSIMFAACFGLASSAWLSPAALAQTAAPADSSAPRADDSVYQAFGGKPGLQKLMADFVPRLKADPRIGEFFKDTKLDVLQAHLVDQFCMATGGPCKYEGANMKDAHADMTIRKADFNTLVELLQVSMDGQGVPFSAQNRLLAMLAPLHRDVITAR